MSETKKPALPKLTPRQIVVAKALLSNFNIDGVRADKVATYGQLVIFYTLVFRPSKRVCILCSTQYGKTLFVALACIIIACLQNEVIAVVAPSAEKAKLTMRYFIEHLGDNDIFTSELEANTKLERLKLEGSKERIMLKSGGGIYVVSAQERSSGKAIESAMGQGARIVIGDEYGLVNDNTEATIFRMIAGKGKDGFYCKIGNPFYADEPYSHFWKTWDEEDNYEKIFIDHNIAVKEGRYSQEFLDESKKKPMFDILYGCEFPQVETTDKDGYNKLLTKSQTKYVSKDELLRLIEEDRQYRLANGLAPIRIKLGVDIGGGGDKSVFIVRYGKFAYIAGKLNVYDTMKNVEKVIELIETMSIREEDVAIDDIGIGRGVKDRLIELGYGINGVAVGMPANDSSLYANIKAELFWAVRLWSLEGGMIEDETDMRQIHWIRYKVQTGEKKIIIEPKEFVRKRHKQSPDHADALALTFYEPSFLGFL